MRKKVSQETDKTTRQKSDKKSDKRSDKNSDKNFGQKSGIIPVQEVFRWCSEGVQEVDQKRFKRCPEPAESVQPVQQRFIQFGRCSGAVQGVFRRVFRGVRGRFMRRFRGLNRP